MFPFLREVPAVYFLLFTPLLWQKEVNLQRGEEARRRISLLGLPQSMSFLCNGLIRFCIVKKELPLMRCRNFFSAAIRQGSGAWPPFPDNNSWICLFFTLVSLSRHCLVFPFHPNHHPPSSFLSVCIPPTLFFVSFYVPVSHRDLCSGLWWPWHLCVRQLPL